MAGSELQVMVIEDHGFQRRIALRLLAELGIERTLEGADGLHALDVLRRQPSPPDVVLVDLDMPGMDGIECIGQIAQERLARAVVVVSALDPALLNTVQTMARAYGLRVLGSVEKPLTRDKLRDVLARFGEHAGEALIEAASDFSVPALLAALEQGEIVPWFQPQAELGNGKVVGVEALARWERSDGSVVRPLQFVSLLEREGQAHALTERMLDEGCRWLRRWNRDGMRLKLSVNVSPLALADAQAADRYQAIVENHALKPEDVVLELTESSVMADAACGLSVLARLRLKGFGLSIDDFGTGYSSLAQLAQVPFSELKIDKEFVCGAHLQPRKRAMVEASLDLARKLRLATVAEGVESAEDWQLLAELGCEVAQGWLIGRPVPGSELPAAIARWRRPVH
ncbi:EAL domain-containing response regulator [Thermomonas sp. S9]|uniref:EAL domain-containing response regulator n=1 Tax=Thermomonas sp. S9 TaxID=2885203 RepID=UPI00216B44C2|nr:EAL domain-containing response regulator [Thermomonas sp. S9]MCR6495116.1 EAL domain-containing response regulator [Thermomonas sp. S9]